MKVKPNNFNIFGRFFFNCLKVSSIFLSLRAGVFSRLKGLNYIYIALYFEKLIHFYRNLIY